MKEIIKDYLGLEIPIWMQSRKNLFLLFCTDFILFILIKTDYLTTKTTSQSILLIFLLAILWCLISYINGKYSYYKNDAYLINKFFNLIKSNLFSLTLIYIVDKVVIAFYPGFLPFSRDSIILLGIFSFSLQFIKLYIYNIISRKKVFYLLGSKEEIEYFRNLIKELPIFKKIKIGKFSKKMTNNISKISLIVFSKIEIYEEINKFYPNLEIEKYTPFRWCEKYLNRIPSNYLTKEECNKNNWLVNSDNFQWRLKRFGDLSISMFIIIFSLPIVIIFSFLIWFEDKGPIFYSQTRTGLNGKNFILTKLRTMKQSSEEHGPVWASKNDRRVTKIGKILRRTRIDELPQLLSVLVGDMSLIGPRPERPEIEIILKKNIPYYELREVIKPGLSGWAQVNFPYGASIEDSKVKLSYELFYIRNHSFWLDILILIKTVKLILTMKGSNPKK